MKIIKSKDFLLEKLKLDTSVLFYASDKFKNDKDFLYEVKDIYPKEYECLKRYEREDKLKSKLENKPKIKI